MNDRKFINDIKNKILTSSNIFVMGHRGIDLDAFGSCLGIFYIAQSLNKNCYIILEEDSSDTSIVKAKKELENRNIESSFYKTKDILDKIDDKSLLIIVDTNKKELVQSKELYDRISEKIVFDHHTFENNNDFLYFYIDDKISSTSEIIISLIISLDVSIPSFVATIMLGGISIDTNNFTLKTGYNTYLSASILTRLGADNKEVQQLLKEDVSEYFDIQKVIQNILIVKEKIALCVCDDGIYEKEKMDYIFNANCFSFSICWYNNI